MISPDEDVESPAQTRAFDELHQEIDDLHDKISDLTGDVERLHGELQIADSRLSEVLGDKYCTCGECVECLTRTIHELAAELDGARREFESMQRQRDDIERAYESYTGKTEPLLDELSAWRKLIYSMRSRRREYPSI